MMFDATECVFYTANQPRAPTLKQGCGAGFNTYNVCSCTCLVVTSYSQWPPLGTCLPNWMELTETDMWSMTAGTPLGDTRDPAGPLSPSPSSLPLSTPCSSCSTRSDLPASRKQFSTVSSPRSATRALGEVAERGRTRNGAWTVMKSFSRLDPCSRKVSACCIKHRERLMNERHALSTG